MKLHQTIPSLLFCFAITTLIETTESTKATKLQNNYADTTDVVIKVCFGPPGKAKDGTDYEATVCTYQYKNQKLIMYKVLGFDLVYKDEKAQTSKVFHVAGNSFHPVRSFIISIDSSTINHLFLDNVTFVDSNEDSIIAKGLKRLSFTRP